MRPCTLTLRDFPTLRAERDVTLPERGVVLVTGANGSGKSSLIEAIAWTVWGKTLRGSKVEDAPRVRVDLYGGGWVEREGNSIRFGGTTQFSGEYPTRTKAHEHLSNLFGSWDEWKRTHVFSSADSAAFALATDGERKRLVEKILGVERFDTALDECRSTLGEVRAEISKLEQELSDQYALLGASRVKLKDASDTAEQLLSQNADEVAELEALIIATEGKITELSIIHDTAAKSPHDHALLAQRANLKRDAEQEKVRLIESGKCETCGQAVEGSPDAHRTALAEHASAAEIHAKGKTHWRKKADDAIKARDAANKKLGDLRARLKATKDRDAILEKLHRAKAQASSDVQDYLIRVEDTKHRLKEATKSKAVLETCEKVLGLKGARTLVLERAMEAVGEAANAWLKRLSNGALGIKMSFDHTDGLLQIQVEGAGGGTYEGCSGGQRRRIDLALLLALAEVSSIVVGRQHGTLWLDEVFDALDADGIHAAVDAVRALAEKRCVVVITHVPELAEALNPDVHIKC